MRTIIAAIAVIAITSGCMEHRYYHKNNNQHSENYNKRHHRENQPRLDINLHN